MDNLEFYLEGFEAYLLAILIASHRLKVNVKLIDRGERFASKRAQVLERGSLHCRIDAAGQFC